ncbi:MAG: DUF3524 domain-containing protein [Saprospiraceae bacterium]|nr:DUF3524 domain-containing protein [Saprospiraceae bacterium]
MKILLIDPYLTPSHETWLGCFSRLKAHEIQILTLPPYHWKWRMHGGAIILAQQFVAREFDPDVVIATEMLDLNLFMAQCRKSIRSSCRWIIYFHENQLNYPVSNQDLDRQKNYDNHYAFINYTSALVADWIVFNSRYHQNSFFERLHPFLRQFPDHQLDKSIGALEKKSSVIYPGYNAQQIEQNKRVSENTIPVILWNHRWEYDKDPDTFFNALFSLSDEGLKFGLVVLGQSFRQIPSIFHQAREKLSAHILHWGYLENRKEYDHWLWKSDIAISTSNQDFFGISVVEAIYANCYPLLPDRLAFPEHIPDHLRHRHLYSSQADLLTKLRALLTGWRADDFDNHLLKEHLQDYHYDKIAVEYEKLLEQLHSSKPGPERLHDHGHP